MNSIFSLLLALTFFLGFNFTVRAQGLVAFPQGDAAWSADITIETPTTSPPPGARIVPAGSHPTHVEVTQLNNLKRTQITWSDGKTSEKWAVPGLPVTFYEDPSNGLVRARQHGSQMELITDLSLTYDSFAFTWISAGDLKEKDPIQYQDKQCFHYLGRVLLPFPGAVKVYSKREAWIDAKTLLPVAFDNGDSLTVFKFQDKPPTGPLTPPPAFQKEIVYYKTVMGYR